MYAELEQFSKGRSQKEDTHLVLFRKLPRLSPSLPLIDNTTEHAENYKLFDKNITKLVIQSIRYVL